MAVPPPNGLASLPVMVVSPLSNVRWVLLASALLLLTPAGALAEAPAPAPAQPAATAPVPVPPVAAVQAPAPPPVAPAQAAAPAVALADELPDPFATAPMAPEEPEGLGWTLVRTLLLLLAVLGCIYLTLNVGLRRLMGLQGVSAGRQSLVTVVERVPLDQRRTLFVLKAADEYLLVGGGETGLQLLSKLDTQAVERIRAERPPANVVPLSPFLQKLLSRRTGSTPRS
ncbi:MAG: flagellar biosynthetic protein FliO [Myxococcaceae bacterium]|nr:flagellar biosynthetic protein FliO [Myxococcaceae bacterium]